MDVAMKRILVGWVCFAIMLSTALAMEGPYPLPFGAHPPSANPTSRMTAYQKKQVSEAFVHAQNAVKQNHTLCKSRTECLRLDLTTLQSFINSNLHHPATPLFQTLHKAVHHDAHHQTFITQWVIFQSLSWQRQQEYRGGLRVYPLPPSPPLVKSYRGTTLITIPGHYNQDDVLTILLQEVDHHHKNCEEYAHCLSTDLKRITNLSQRLAPYDPTRLALKDLYQRIERTANQNIFNTSLYLNLYNPLSPNWHDTLSKHRAKKSTIYGRKEWRQVEKSSHPTRWKWIPARLINGQPAATLQNRPLPSSAKSGSPTSPDWLKYGKEMWKAWKG